MTVFHNKSTKSATVEAARSFTGTFQTTGSTAAGLTESEAFKRLNVLGMLTLSAQLRFFQDYRSGKAAKERTNDIAPSNMPIRNHRLKRKYF